MDRNSFFADDGWAFWINGDDTSTIYLNEWAAPAAKSYVDIGVHIRGIQESTGLHIYIPFLVTRDEIEDVSLQIKTQNMLYAVFGVSGIIEYKKNACTSELAYKGKVIDLVHLSALSYDCKPLAEGTLLEVPFEPLFPYLDNDEAYFLFRIPHKSLDAIFHPKKSVQDWLDRLQALILSPVVSNRYGCSVRINESRLLPEEITKISAFHRQKLKKASVTIFLPNDYEINDMECYQIRRLETNLYQDYIPGEFDWTDAVAYEWEMSRVENLHEHFNFYFMIRHEYIKKTSLLAYLIIINLTGSIGDTVLNFFKWLIHLIVG